MKILLIRTHSKVSGDAKIIRLQADMYAFADSTETLDDGADVDAGGELDEFATGLEDGADENEKHDDPDKTANDGNSDAKADEFVIVHKNHSKRSLDDAELEEDGELTPGSPGMCHTQ